MGEYAEMEISKPSALNRADDLLSCFGSETEKQAVVECPKPGVYPDVPNHIYHAWDALSSTRLKSFAANPSTCRAPYVPGDDANVGSGIHAYTLQGQEGLDAECLIGPKFGTGKKDAEEKATLVADNPTKTILPASYGTPAPGLPIMDVLTGVDTSLRSHPKIGPILAESEKEISLVWIDPVSGLKCKARLDIWESQYRIIWDLKKTIGQGRFIYQIQDLRYLVQAGHYFGGATICGMAPIAFGFIPVEAKPPFLCECGYVAYLPRDDEEDYDYCRKINECVENAQRLVSLYKESVERDYWPNFSVPDLITTWDQLTPETLIKFY